MYSKLYHNPFGNIRYIYEISKIFGEEDIRLILITKIFLRVAAFGYLQVILYLMFIIS